MTAQRRRLAASRSITIGWRKPKRRIDAATAPTAAAFRRGLRS
jgi:hypothetical protein